MLSTLHTNTAVGAVTRLRDMGVEPFLLSSSLIGVLAQRLVRVLNPGQQGAVSPPANTSAACSNVTRDDALAHAVPARARRDAAASAAAPASTSSCIVDDTMRTMIHDGAAEHELERYARTLTPGIRDDGRAQGAVAA